MSRILTLIKVQETHAVKITLEIKKEFVRANQTEVTQEELEQMLFAKLKEFGYGEQIVSRYKTVTRFYQKKIPFIIIVSGTRCMGKSTLITQLADLVNISNILQTRIVANVMSQFLSDTESLQSKHNIDENSPQEQDQKKQPKQGVIERFKLKSKAVRNGCNFDLSKAFNDGKPLIIEGAHITPEFYCLPTKVGEEGMSAFRIITDQNEDELEPLILMQKKMNAFDQSKALIVPFLLTIDEKAHRQLIEKRLIMINAKKQQMSQQEFVDLDAVEKQLQPLLEPKLTKYQIVQDHLQKVCAEANYTEIQINVNRLEVTINQMHDKILESIESCAEILNQP